MRMLMSVIDWFYIVHKTGVTGVATMQIKIAFLSLISSACLNVDFVSLLSFPHSICYYCVTMHLLLLWWSRIKRMNE